MKNIYIDAAIFHLHQDSAPTEYQIKSSIYIMNNMAITECKSMK